MGEENKLSKGRCSGDQEALQLLKAANWKQAMATGALQEGCEHACGVDGSSPSAEDQVDDV